MTALRKSGEKEARLFGLGTWREQAGYTEREQAALTWAEAVTEVAASRVGDAVYEHVSAQFTQRAVVAINGWNRLCVAFRTQPARRAITADAGPVNDIKR